MGKLDRVIAVGALLCACSGGRTVEEAKPAAAIPRAKAALPAPARDPRFDEAGNLRPGPQKVGWLEIPLAFERTPGSSERVGVFEAEGISPAQVRQFVTARGKTEQVEYAKNGELYRRLEPTHTQLPLPPVSVDLQYQDTSKKRLRLVVEDHTAAEPTLSPQEAMDKLAKARDRLE